MFIIIIVVLVVIAAVVVRRMMVGRSSSHDTQVDEVYELLEDHASPHYRDELIGRIEWDRTMPDPDHTPGCFIILTYADKKTRRDDPDDYELAYVGRSSTSATNAAIKHLVGNGHPQLAEAIKDEKAPYAVAILTCEDYGMDVEDCEHALRKVLADERLLAKK